jgi:hypothetical protein
VTTRSFLGTQLERLAAFEAEVSFGFANFALQSQGNLLCCLSFLVENWLCLATETALFSVVSSLALSKV